MCLGRMMGDGVRFELFLRHLFLRTNKELMWSIFYVPDKYFIEKMEVP